MNWIIFLVILIGGAYLLLNKGKVKFWKIVSSDPEKAYLYFKDNSTVWKVCDSEKSKDFQKFIRDLRPQDKDKWVGPYRLYVPSINQTIHIYGKAESYEQEQDKFLALISDAK